MSAFQGLIDYSMAPNALRWAFALHPFGVSEGISHQEPPVSHLVGLCGKHRRCEI